MKNTTIIFLPFDEVDGVPASDREGALLDLTTPVGMGVPAVVDGWTGSARSFDPSTSDALATTDAPGGDTLLTRDVTIQAIVSLDLAGAGGDAMTIACRGFGGALAAEAYAYGLELQESATPGTVVVRWLWQDRAGTVVRLDVGTFIPPAAGAPFLLTATRRWSSTSLVTCRVYVGDVRIGVATSATGDIGGGTTGGTSIGAMRIAGIWSQFYSGTIEQLTVANYEMSAEEIKSTWSRMVDHQAQGVERIRALSPPGAPWSTDPASRIGRLIKVAGAATGMATGKADELRRNFLPDHAYTDTLERWERLVGVAPRLLDSLDDRRVRVLAFMSQENGYSLPQIRAALAPLFDQAAADVSIIEGSNTVTDPFASLDLQRWRADAASQWSVSSGTLAVAVASGVDIRPEVPCHARMSVGSQTVRTAYGAASHLGDGATYQVKLATFWGTLPTSAIVGLYMSNRRKGSQIWWGVYNDAGTLRLGYRLSLAGVLGAFVAVTTASAAVKYLRIRNIGGTQLALGWSATGFASGISETVIAAALDEEWCGVAAMCSDATTATALAATFDDWLVRAPRSETPYVWYAYRNPALPGSPDMIGADSLVRRLRPAHTYAAAVSVLTMLCDDPTRGCDAGPIGIT